MKKVVIASLLVLFLQGCHWDINRENLNKIEIGMSRAQVLEIMGKPYRREVEEQDEWLLYETERKRRWYAESAYLTPLVFRDGELVGWGKNYWTTKEQKYDVKIDQRIKQE